MLGLDQVLLRRIPLELLIRANDPFVGYGAVPLHALAGHEVGVPARGLFPELFDTTFGPLADAGAILKELPDVDILPTDLRPGRKPLAVVKYRFKMEAPRTGLVWCGFDPPIHVPFRLVRRADQASGVTDAFWALAKRKEIRSG